MSSSLWCSTWCAEHMCTLCAEHCLRKVYVLRSICKVCVTLYAEHLWGLLARCQGEGKQSVMGRWRGRKHRLYILRSSQSHLVFSKTFVYHCDQWWGGEGTGSPHLFHFPSDFILKIYFHHSHKKGCGTCTAPQYVLLQLLPPDCQEILYTADSCLEILTAALSCRQIF